MWGAIIGGALGLMGANKQAKAQDAANAANMASFNQYRPYVDSNLRGSHNALGGVLSTGAYRGPTYAGPNQFQTGTATTMGNAGMNMMGSGSDLMANTNSFGSNANDLYGQFQGLAADAQQDRLDTAMDYAANNSDDLVRTAMRDDYRNLMENQLTGNNLAASNSGNMNSSRAGVADAIAERAYQDRQADVTAQIQNSLIDRSLNQQAQQFADQGTALNAANRANQNIMGAYNTGLNTLGEGANFGMNAGNALQQFDQRQMDADRADFERMRDFELQQRMNFQSGVLGAAPTTSNKVSVNKVDPFQSAVGGAMQGFGFQNKYGGSLGNSSIFDGLFGGSGLGSFS